MKTSQRIVMAFIVFSLAACTSSKKLNEDDEFATDDVAATTDSTASSGGLDDVSEFDLTEAATDAPAAAESKDEFADFDTASTSTPQAEAPAATDEFADFDMSTDTASTTPPADAGAVDELTLDDTPPVSTATTDPADIPPAIDTPPPTVDPAPVAETPVQPEPVVTEAPEAPVVARVKAVNYKSNKNGGTIVIQADRPLDFTTRLNQDTNQLVVEIKNAVVPGVLKRPLNTRDMDSSIGSVDVYQKSSSSVARFVIQLRPGSPEPLVQPEGDSLLVIGAATKVAQKEEGEVVNATSLEGFVDLSTSGVMGSKALEQFLVGNQRFYGKKISIETNNLDIREALKFIAEESGINLLLDENIQGNVSLKLRQVPWDQALVLLLRSKKLGYMRQGNVLRIARMEDLQDEELKAFELLEKRRLAEPLIVKRFFVNYLKLDDLEVKIREFMIATQLAADQQLADSLGTKSTAGDSGAGGAAPMAPQTPNSVANAQGVTGMPTSTNGTANRPSDMQNNMNYAYKGRVISDERTSSLIVTDTVTNLAKIEKLILSLDVQPRQIMVESRVVNASESFTESLGINWTSTPNAADVNRLTLGMGSGNTSNGSNVNTTFTWGNLDIIGNLSAAIRMAELKDIVRTVQSTRTTVLSGQTAAVDSSSNIRIKKTGTVAGTGSTAVTEEYDNIKVGLIGTIMPKASNKGTITSEIMLEQSTLDDPVTGSTSTRKTGGRVIARSGQTIVVSANFGSRSSNVKSGVPGLKDIPVLGSLFRGSTREDSKFEQMLFSTQTILDPIEDKELTIGAAEPEAETVNK